MSFPDKAEVSRSAAYIYVEASIAAFSGYILWLILSRVTSPDVIGLTSTLISISTILISVVTMGIPNSIPRFLGKAFSEGNIKASQIYIIAGIFLILPAVVAVGITVWVLSEYDYFPSVQLDLLLITITFVGSSAFAIFLRYVVISSLITRTLIWRETAYSLTKVVLAIVLLSAGLGAMGLMTGYTVSQFMAIILLALAIRRIYVHAGNGVSNVKLTTASRNILLAGIPSWIPALITSIGAQLGTVLVYGSQGAIEAASYFIAFAIATGITSITYSLLSATFPALSAMKDGRKRFAWQLTKVCLVISVPLASSLIFVSQDVMGLFGPSYIQGSGSLQILMLSITPTAIMTGINILVYSYGNYKQVLLIGIAASIPRTILYLFLIPLYGDIGAAESYTIGAFVGLIASAVVAGKIGLKLFWRDLFLLQAIPIIVGFVISYLLANYILSMSVTIILSYVFLLKFSVVNRIDVNDSLAFIPKIFSGHVLNTVNIIAKRLNKSY